MAVLIEQIHPGEVISSCDNPELSFEKVVVASGQKLVAGEVVGRVTKGSGSSAAGSGNTGNGVMGAITVGNGSIPGVYVLTIIEPGTNAGDFFVEDPNGKTIGTGDVASAFSAAGIAFTLADGATDFKAGDTFELKIAEGSLEVAAFDPSATNGTEVAVGCIYDEVDATTAAADGVLIARLAVVVDELMGWPVGLTVDQKSAAVAELKKQHLIVR